MNSITRLIAVIQFLCKMTATIASTRKDDKGNTYYTLAGIPAEYNEVKVSSRGGLWSNMLGSFWPVEGEVIRYETEIALRICFPNVQLHKKNLRPAPAVIAAPAPAVPEYNPELDTAINPAPSNERETVSSETIAA